MNISFYEPSFSLTPEQTAIVNSAREPLLITARAGCGKTSTLLLCNEENPAPIFCYNKKIAEEIAGKGAESKTWHAFCLAFLRKEGFRGRLDGFADTKHCFHMWPRSDDQEQEMIRKRKLKFMGKIIPILKENLATLEEIPFYMREFGIPFLSVGEVKEVYEKKATIKDQKISFSDLLVLAHDRREDIPKLRFAYVDEAQDTNPIQLSLAETMFERATFVGDPAQAIYSFRGAGMGSFTRIAASFHNNKLLPLSVSFRCARSIIRLANEIVPDIQTRREEEGKVERLTSLPNTLPPGSAVLARTNAELIPLLMNLLSKGIPVSFKDKGFLSDVLDTLDEIDLVGQDTVKQGIYKEKEKSARVKLEVLFESALLCKRDFLLTALRNDIKDAPTLGTIHSAKGLEWDTVFLFDWFVDREKLNDREIQEEENLRYVAITRARNNLFIIERA